MGRVLSLAPCGLVIESIEAETGVLVILARPRLLRPRDCRLSDLQVPLGAARQCARCRVRICSPARTAKNKEQLHDRSLA